MTKNNVALNKMIKFKMEFLNEKYKKTGSLAILIVFILVFFYSFILDITTLSFLLYFYKKKKGLNFSNKIISFRKITSKNICK